MFPLSCHCCRLHISLVFILEIKCQHGRLHISSAFLQLGLSRTKQDVWDFSPAGNYLQLQGTPLRINLTLESKAKDPTLQSASQSLEEMTFKKLEISQHYSVERLSQHVILFDSERQEIHAWLKSTENFQPIF